MENVGLFRGMLGQFAHELSSARGIFEEDRAYFLAVGAELSLLGRAETRGLEELARFDGVGVGDFLHAFEPVGDLSAS